MDNIIKLEGVKLIKATHGGRKIWNNRTKRYEVNPDEVVTSLTLAELTEDDYALIAHAFESTPSNFIPKWFKEGKGFCNMTTSFKIPTVEGSTEYSDLTELIESESRLIGSTINIFVDLKNGAVYPSAIRITSFGEEKNPFEGL